MDPKLETSLPTLRKTYMNWRFAFKHYEMLPVYMYIALGWTLAISFTIRQLFFHPEVNFGKNVDERMNKYRNKNFLLLGRFFNDGKVSCPAPEYELPADKQTDKKN